jgi:leader peptidase (prepilin peptidase)/N-methyltransferase
VVPHGVLVAFGAALGAAVGSFLNVVADRVPDQDSLLSPPSHCNGCGRQLAAAELVPVASYLALRGRCRACGAPIGWRVLWVEAGTGLLFALAVWRFPPPDARGWAGLLLTWACLAMLVVVTVTDLERGLILNRVMVPAIGLGLLVALSAGWPGLLLHLAAGVLGAGVIALIIALVPGGMGWGDARLAGFIGLATGLPGLLFALFTGFVSGGLLGGALLASRRLHRGDTVPLGPFLAFGGAITLLFGAEMLRVFYTLSAALFG